MFMLIVGSPLFILFYCFYCCLVVHLQLTKEGVGSLAGECLVNANNGRRELCVSTCDLKHEHNWCQQLSGIIRHWYMKYVKNVSVFIHSVVWCPTRPVSGGPCCRCSECSSPGWAQTWATAAPALPPSTWHPTEKQIHNRPMKMCIKDRFWVKMCFLLTSLGYVGHYRPTWPTSGEKTEILIIKIHKTYKCYTSA